ncbi:MAG: hypothetical protein TREMPRED_001247 [Tremellales sp. Tagirdzhanova-0007]|nr:MAG: hypothetical protein TREMPRED_001247 [Tremellales sp. Tagirdzhanova-0007]
MSPTLHPERLTAARSDPSLPLLTRLIARVIPDADHWTERIDRHLALSKQAAEDKLLIQDAQQPKVRRLGIPRSFEVGSPHSVPVGPQIDMSNVTRNS